MSGTTGHPDDGLDSLTDESLISVARRLGPHLQPPTDGHIGAMPDLFGDVVDPITEFAYDPEAGHKPASDDGIRSFAENLVHRFGPANCRRLAAALTKITGKG